MMQKKEKQASIPGVFATLAAGFDLATKHFWLFLIPIFLDSFLWLGPRLSLRLLVEQMASFLQQNGGIPGMNEQLLALAPHTNLFTSLSVPLLGVPVLMAAVTPEVVPATPYVFELDNVGLVAGLFLLFTLVGIFLTAVYFTLIARTVERSEAGFIVDNGRLLSRIFFTWLRLLAVIIAFLVVMLIIYIPLAMVSMLVSFLSSTLGLLVMFMGPLIAVWLVMAAYFVPQGLTLYGRSPAQALMISLQLIRIHGTTAMGLILAVMLIGGLMDQFLVLMEDGSWITLVSILTHAFVSTSLITATFIFYRDRVKGFNTKTPNGLGRV